jgi:hypothetical protein
MSYMNWFEMKEYYDGTRDDCGLTAEDRAEQLAMMREDFEERGIPWDDEE